MQAQNVLHVSPLAEVNGKARLQACLTRSQRHLERQIAAFVDYYNNQRYHKSPGNLTPADVYFRRDEQILKQREEIKRKTMLKRRLRHQTENA